MGERTQRGRVELVHGSMFSGKTEHLLARLRQEQAAGRSVIAFKHAIDDRYDPDHLVTHRNDRFDAIRIADAGAALQGGAGMDVVAVDEVHFFGNALVAVVEELVGRGATVLLAGITNDAWGRPFAPIPELIALADEETLLRAPCRVCGEPSPYSQRMVAVGDDLMVGGSESYEPRCAEHFTPLAVGPASR